MPINNSSTRGYLAANPSASPEGQALEDFLQAVVVGLTGLPGAMVRPRWQPEPPNAPDFTTSWAAIGINRRHNDTFATVIHDGGASVTGTDASDTVFRQQELNLLASFYGPNADLNAQLMTQGFSLPQNRDALKSAKMDLIEVDDPVLVPELVNMRNRYRVDVPFRLRRALTSVYPVLNLISASGTVGSDAGTTPFSVTED